jgi:hypothetical protein
MKDEELKQLEDLLGKLESVLKRHFCIIPGYVQDGYYIGLYDTNGDNYVSVSGPELKGVIDQAIQKRDTFQKT